MKYYKNASNEVQTADRIEHEALIPAGYTEITKTEYDILQAPVILKSVAKQAIDTSDITILRCYENAVVVPAAWQVYREDLRAIIAGTSAATELPTRPEYPVGT